MRAVVGIAAFALLLATARPAAAQGRPVARGLSCGIFAGSVAASADVVGEDLGGFILGLGLAIVAGRTSRYCLYGPRPELQGFLARRCDETFALAPLIGLTLYGAAGGNIEEDLPTGLLLLGSGLGGAVARQELCADLESRSGSGRLE